MHHPKVEELIFNSLKFKNELQALRKIVLECMLVEEYKWKQPCYTYNNKNVVILSEFKNYCGLNFFKGSLLKDDAKILVKPGENTQSSRSIRFTNLTEIMNLEPVLKPYIFEAIEIEKSGLKIDYKSVEEYDIPKELKVVFSQDNSFKSAFYQLTAGRQKGYLLYFSQAKQSKTRTSRIQKYIPRILDGKGIHDCTCGLSKKMPNCDGSHKYIS